MTSLAHGCLRCRALLVLTLLAACAPAPQTEPAPEGAEPVDVQPGVEAPPTTAAPAPERAETIDEQPVIAAPATGEPGDAGWTGVTTRATELKSAPTLDGEDLASLPQGTEVTVRARLGGWYQVDAPSSAGWIRLLHVAAQSPAPEQADELETAAAIATGRTAQGAVVQTTGIRGLRAEELATAEPDLEAVARLEAFAVTQADAAARARSRGLERRRVEDLAEPTR